VAVEEDTTVAEEDKVAVEEDTTVAEEGKVVVEEGTAAAEEEGGAADKDQRVAVASNYRYSTYNQLIPNELMLQICLIVSVQNPYFPQKMVHGYVKEPLSKKIFTYTHHSRKIDTLQR
jgi:hypothetical protein